MKTTDFELSGYEDKSSGLIEWEGESASSVRCNPFVFHEVVKGGAIDIGSTERLPDPEGSPAYVFYIQWGRLE